MRLALLIVTLVAAVVCFSVLDLVDREDVRGWVDASGPLAPLAFVALAGVLGALLVPGALLAAAAGLLFGAFVGTFASVAAAVLSAVLAVLVARHSGARAQADALGRERLERLRVALREHGVGTVALQRLLPAVPDGPLSHAFALLGVGAGQIALGTLIGSAPRAFSYAALGASVDDPESPLMVAGVAGLVLTGIVGAALGRRALRRPRPAA